MSNEAGSEGGRREAGADLAEIDLGLVTIDLRAELTPAELEQFLANAAAAGRTPAEHFKAITLGEPRASAA